MMNTKHKCALVIIKNAGNKIYFNNQWKEANRSQKKLIYI